LQRLERERARAVRGAREPARAHERERALRRHELRAVDQREALLRGEPDRLEADARQRLEPGQPLALDERLALADERQREMRERREVTRGADRAARRNDRDDAARETFEQQLDGLDPRAGIALRERVRAQEHRGPHDLVGIRVADAARVRAEQPQLELLRQLLRDRPVHEAAEAGVDAVGVLARAVRGALHELAGRRHLFARALGERRRRQLDRRGPDVCDREVVAGEADRGALGHASESSVGPCPSATPRSCGRACSSA
jgi:hypothetical protein